MDCQKCCVETYLAVVCSWTIRVEHAALVVNVAGVEELVVPVPWFAAVGHVSSHRIEVAYAVRESDVAGIVEAGVAEHAEAIL